MGISLSGTVFYKKPAIESLASLPAVTVALSEAVIDRAYLTWLDVNKLMQAFPQHVSFQNTSVILKGPVALVTSMSPARRLALQCVIAAAAGVFHYFAVNFFLPNEASVVKKEKDIKPFITKFFAVLAAGTAFYAAGKYLPTQAGVYFYNQPPFIV